MRQISCLHKKSIDDPLTGEIVCSDCGVVLESKTSNESDPGYYPERRDRDRGHHGPSLSNTFHENLSTSISKFNSDASHKKLNQQQQTLSFKLRRYDHNSKITDFGPEKRRKIHYLEKIQYFTEQLQLPQNIVRETYRLFHTLARNGFAKGRRTPELVAACIYISCKNNGFFLDQKQFVKRFSLRKKLCRFYVTRIMIDHNIKPNIPLLLETELVLERITEELHIKYNIKEIARLIIQKFYEKKPLHILSPKPIAGAALHLAVQSVSGFLTSQVDTFRYVMLKEISETLGITEVTIRNYKKIIAEELDILKLVDEIKKKTYQEVA